MKCLERLKFANRDAATGMTTNRGVCVLNTHVHLRENHLRNKFASRNYRTQLIHNYVIYSRDCAFDERINCTVYSVCI